MLAHGRGTEAEPLLCEAIAILADKVSEEHVWLYDARATPEEWEGEPAGFPAVTPQSDMFGLRACRDQGIATQIENDQTRKWREGAAWLKRFLRRRNEA